MWPNWKSLERCKTNQWHKKVKNSESKTTFNSAKWAFFFLVSVDCTKLGHQHIEWNCMFFLLWKTGILSLQKEKKISPKLCPVPSPVSHHLFPPQKRLRWFIWTIRHEEEFNLFLIVLHYVWAGCIVGRLGKGVVAQIQESQWLPLNDWLWGASTYILYSYWITATSCTFVLWVLQNTACAY